KPARSVWNESTEFLKPPFLSEHKLLSTGPTEPWSIREKLCLASSVMRSGDQNWVSVSRAIKPFAEPGRPPDWFSQKHCASQYSELLETTETPKRKRGEKGEVVETVEDVIVRKLTAERVEELKKVIKETQERYRRLKRDAELIQAGHMDSRLDELCNDIAMKKKLEEEEAEVKRKATDAAYQARQAVKTPPRRLPTVMVRSPIDSASPGGDYPLGDLTPTSIEEATSGGVLLEVGGVLPMIHGGEIQQTPNTVAASPAASAKVAGSNPQPGPAKTTMTAAKTLDIGICMMLICVVYSTLSFSRKAISLQISLIIISLIITSGAPTLSRLLEAGPTQFTTPLASFTTVASEPPVKLVPPPPESMLSPSHGSNPIDDPLEAETQHKFEMSGIMGCGQVEEVGQVSVERKGKAKVEKSSGSLSLLCRLIERRIRDYFWKPDKGISEFSLFLLPLLSFNKLTSLFSEMRLVRSWGQVRYSRSIIATHASHLKKFVNITVLSLHTVHKEALTHKAHKAYTQILRITKAVVTELKVIWCGAAPVAQRSRALTPYAGGDGFKPSPRTLYLGSEFLSRAREKKDAPGEDEEEDGVSEVASLEEPKEEDQGEGYLSEMDNEPPVSESDDGFSIHNATLQSHTLADSIPSSPASSQFSVCSEDQEAIQAQKIWKKAIMLVWRAAANHRYANVFLQPVTDDIAPGYHSIVQRPMDLSTIKKNIENGLIRSTAEFQRDIMLMFQNAVMYNSSDHDVYHMAVEMQRDVLEQIQQFLATQLIMQTSESGISAKSLRGRDSTRKQDASEKVRKPDSKVLHKRKELGYRERAANGKKPSDCPDDGGTRGRRCAIEADMKMKK
uniref:Bromodomain-containing protein 8 n=1 Tax=Otolemur garnettii TaxID=30611 RepID=H0WMP6_OTOGA